MKKTNDFSWLIIGLVGVLLIVGQKFIKNALYMVMALGLIAAAVANIQRWWRDRDRSVDGIVRLLGSLAMLGIGIWILFHPTAFDTIINVLIGLILIITGVVWIVRGFRMGRDMVVIVMAAIAVVLGLLIACTNGATGLPVVLAGLGLIYSALAGIVGEKRLG